MNRLSKPIGIKLRRSRKCVTIKVHADKQGEYIKKSIRYGMENEDKNG